MAKTKTSKKPESSLKERSLATEWNFNDHNTIEGLKEGIRDALFDNDIETFQGLLLIILDHFNYRDIVKDTGLSKSTLYRMCHPNSNPTLSNVCKVLSYIDKSAKSA